MPSVIQTVAVNGLAGVSSVPVTIAATGAGNAIIVTMQVDVGTSGNYSTFTITDNKSNSGYTAQKIQTANTRTAAVYALLSPATAGVTTVTIVGNGGVGGMFGCLAVQEVSGLSALDQTGGGNTGATSPLTLSCSSVDTTATDFVTAAISVGGATSSTGISDPPSGYTHSAVEQDDIADSGGECCYRINSSAVTDSVTWSASVWANGCPAVIASFTASGGGGSNTTIAPTVGAVNASGQTPALFPVKVTPLVGAIASAATGPVLNLMQGPTVGSLTLTGVVVTQTLTVPVPPAGVALFSGVAPGVTISSPSVIPTAGAAALGGLSATLNLGLASSAGAFAFTGVAPNRALGTVLTPPLVGTLSLFGIATTLTRGNAIAPNAGAVAFSGAAGALGLGISSTLGALALTGQFAGIGTHGAIAAQTGALTVSGAGPAVGISLTPNVGASALNGISASLKLSLTPSTGSLALVGNVTAFGFTVIAPATAVLALTGQSSFSNAVLSPAAGQFGFSADVPKVFIGYAPWALYLRPLPAPLARVTGGLLVTEDA